MNAEKDITDKMTTDSAVEKKSVFKKICKGTLNTLRTYGDAGLTVWGANLVDNGYTIGYYIAGIGCLGGMIDEGITNYKLSKKHVTSTVDSLVLSGIGIFLRTVRNVGAATAFELYANEQIPFDSTRLADAKTFGGICSVGTIVYEGTRIFVRHELNSE